MFLNETKSQFMICSVWIREGWLSCCQLKSWASLKNHYRTVITALSLICKDLTLGRNPTFKDNLKDFGNVADVTATFCVRGSFKTSIEKSPTEQYKIEIYRNREQTEETSKSSFENSVQHNPNRCTFTQKTANIGLSCTPIYRKNSPNPPEESLCVDTPARCSFVSLFSISSAALQIKSLPWIRDLRRAAIEI